MKLTLKLLLILLVPVVCFAQPDLAKRDFSKVDALAISVKNIPDLKLLSDKLTAGYKDTIDKVRAIYRWETDNIAYDVAGLKNPNIYQALWTPFAHMDSLSAAPKYQVAVAKYVMGQRKAVCYGYANLFKTLCDYAGIQCVMIDGYGRSDFNVIGQSFNVNHSWNAVNISGKWLLVDCTWGAGIVTGNTPGFKKDFNEGYFLASGETFILDHYPAKTKWALLSKIPELKDFFNSPIVYPAFQSHKLQLSKPMEGVIEAKTGDKLQFEILTNDSLPMYAVFDDIAVSSGSIPGEALRSYSHPDPNNKKLISYEYVVKSKKINTLFVIYGHESILRYKIQVKG